MILLTQLLTCIKNSNFLVKSTTINLGVYKGNVLLIFLYSNPYS